MPLINVFTSAEPPPADAADAMLKDLSKVLASHLSKPEAYVMTCLTPRMRMTFGGTSEPACYAEVKNVGALPEALTEKLSSLLTARLAEGLGVNPERTYIEFSEAEGRLWGHAGSTFA